MGAFAWTLLRSVIGDEPLVDAALEQAYKESAEPSMVLVLACLVAAQRREVRSLTERVRSLEYDVQRGVVRR